MDEGETWREVAPDMAQTALAVEAASGMIVAQALTDQDADDPSQVAPRRCSIRSMANLSG
jgi:hypothetical protein